MIGVDFEHANFTWKGWNEEEGNPQGRGRPPEVYDLPVHRAYDGVNAGANISCWKMTWKERLQVLVSGKVWLWIWGDNHPPVGIETDTKFEYREEGA